MDGYSNFSSSARVFLMLAGSRLYQLLENMSLSSESFVVERSVTASTRQNSREASIISFIDIIIKSKFIDRSKS